MSPSMGRTATYQSLSKGPVRAVDAILQITNCAKLPLVICTVTGICAPSKCYSGWFLTLCESPLLNWGGPFLRFEGLILRQCTE